MLLARLALGALLQTAGVPSQVPPLQAAGLQAAGLQAVALAKGTAAAPWEAQLARAAKPLQAALAMGRPLRVALLA